MSRGPGTIENRIGEMFAETRDRALSVDELADRAFVLNGKPASRAQRSSTIRAAHRQTERRVLWRATTIGRGRGAKLWFHPDDVPVQVWAVTIDPHGVHWFEVDAITQMTGRNVMVRYGGAVARLDRERLAMGSVWWRGVRFVSSRTGFAAAMLDAIWFRLYGAAGASPAMAMPLAEAIRLLGVPQNYTREDVITGFRQAAKKAHPDLGGTADDFRRLVEARDRLLAAIGTSAPPPKMPAYYPSGTRVVYRSAPRRSHRRLGQTRRLAHATAE